MEYIRKRVGKDLRVTWPLTVNKGTVPLFNCDLRLEIVTPNGTMIFPPFVIREDGKAVMFDMLGTEYTEPGCYTFVMWRNFGKIGQTVVDKVHALTLVRHSCEEGVPPGCKLSIDSIEIESGNLEIGQPGEPGPPGPPGPKGDPGDPATVTEENVKEALGYVPGDDDKLVHKTGDETIAGVKTFNAIRAMVISLGEASLGVSLTPALDFSGGTGVSIGNKPSILTNVRDPELRYDAANKQYVDGEVGKRYAKPADGIPKEHLSKEVRDELESKSSGEYIEYIEQDLTDQQKATARNNIDVYSRDEVKKSITSEIELTVGNINALLNTI